MEHPLLINVEARRYSPIELARIYQCRRQVSHRFVSLPECIKVKCEAVGAPALAHAIHLNLSDEYGLDPSTGLDNGLGTHAQWVQDFLAALSAVEPADIPLLSPEVAERLEIYAVDPNLSLSTLTGMLMAAEKCVPIECKIFLEAFQLAYPFFADSSNQHCLLYFFEHIDHDEKRHLPVLIDGFLGDAPGTKSHVLSDQQASGLNFEELFAGLDLMLGRYRRFYSSMEDLL